MQSWINKWNFTKSCKSERNLQEAQESVSLQREKMTREIESLQMHLSVTQSDLRRRVKSGNTHASDLTQLAKRIHESQQRITSKRQILDTIAAEECHLRDVQSNMEISATMEHSLSAQRALQSKTRAHPDDTMDAIIEYRDDSSDTMSRWASEWDASDTTGVHSTNTSEYILSALGGDPDGDVDMAALRAGMSTQAYGLPSVGVPSENQHAHEEVVQMPSVPRGHRFDV